MVSSILVQEPKLPEVASSVGNDPGVSLNLICRLAVSPLAKFVSALISDKVTVGAMVSTSTVASPVGAAWLRTAGLPTLSLMLPLLPKFKALAAILRPSASLSLGCTV